MIALASVLCYHSVSDGTLKASPAQYNLHLFENNSPRAKQHMTIQITDKISTKIKQIKSLTCIRTV